MGNGPCGEKAAKSVYPATADKGTRRPYQALTNLLRSDTPTRCFGPTHRRIEHAIRRIGFDRRALRSSTLKNLVFLNIEETRVTNRVVQVLECDFLE
jgi:hypothetical protein